MDENELAVTDHLDGLELDRGSLTPQFELLDDVGGALKPGSGGLVSLGCVGHDQKAVPLKEDGLGPAHRLAQTVQMECEEPNVLQQ